MEDHRVVEPGSDRVRNSVHPPSCFAEWRRDLILLALLLLAAGSIRAWLVWHTEVAARDSIGYIRYAWHLKHRPWKEVFSTLQQHPGYPVAILAVSEVVRPFTSDPEVCVMQLAAQLASSLAGVLLVVPMFFLGKELFDRRVAFWTTLLFQCMPASGRVLSDGLSEGLFLFFAASSLWAGVRGLQRREVVCFALAGLFSGLAYLVRPEGALLAAAVGFILMMSQVIGSWRLPWRRCAACAAALSLGAGLTAGPLVLTTGRLTTKPTAQRILENTGVIEPGAHAPGLTQAPLFAVWWEGAEEDRDGRSRWSLKAVAVELLRANGFVAWLPGLVALVWYRDRLRHKPGVWVLVVLCLVLTVVLWRVALVVGFLSTRYVLLILLCDLYWIVAGMFLVGWWLAVVLARLRVPQAGLVGPGLLLGGLLAASLPRTIEPLHLNRAGFRDVGLWLAQNTPPTDPVIDPYYWSHYYSGRVFSEVNAPPPPPPGHRPMRYVVVERAGLPHVRLRLLPEAERLKDQGQLVYRWQGERPRTQAEVLVYAVPP